MLPDPVTGLPVDLEDVPSRVDQAVEAIRLALDAIRKGSIGTAIQLLEGAIVRAERGK